MNAEQNSKVEEKLDTIIRLLATQAIEGREYRDQVSVLTSAGLKSTDIAKLTGKTANNVKVTLHLMKKAKKGEKKNAKKT